MTRQQPLSAPCYQREDDLQPYNLVPPGIGLPPIAVLPIEGGSSRRPTLEHVLSHLGPVEHSHQRVLLTRQGKPEAIILDPADLQDLENTIELFSPREPSGDDANWACVSELVAEQLREYLMYPSRLSGPESEDLDDSD